MTRYHRIFAALDGGSTQDAVVRRALSIAHNNNAEILFGHVIDSVPYEGNGIDFAALTEDGRIRIEEELSVYLSNSCEEMNISSLHVQVKAGRVAETLVDALIKPFNPDLVICGVRGLSSIQYAFVGSVSTSLIRNCACDVLVVRPEALEED